MCHDRFKGVISHCTPRVVKLLPASFGHAAYIQHKATTKGNTVKASLL